MSQTKNFKKVETFINPAGFVEQHYKGSLDLEAVLGGLKDLEKQANRAVKTQGKPAFILADLTGLTKVDLSRRMLEARKLGVRLMRELKYERTAIYGPLTIQFLVNTMALVAGVNDRIRVFDSRVKAIKWLRARQAVET